MHCNFHSRWKVFLDFWDIPSQSQPPQYTWHDIAELNYAVEVTPRSQTLNSFHSNAESRKQKPHGVMPTAESDSAVGMPQLSHTQQCRIKGTVHWDFLPPFLSLFKSVWATDQRVKIFLILVRISRSYSNFRLQKWLAGVWYSGEIDLPGYHTPGRLTQQGSYPGEI